MPNTLQCIWAYMKEGSGLFTPESINSVDRGGLTISSWAGKATCVNTYDFFDRWQPFLKDFFVILVTVGVLVGITVGYLALKPQVILNQTIGRTQCPDQWVYRMEDSMCHPLYQTPCEPFNPDVQKGNECDIAKRCSTTWKGLCD